MENEKIQKNTKENKAREDMETGDTARSGTLSGAPPEYGTSARDFLSELAPLGLQLLEPHDHQLVTTVEIRERPVFLSCETVTII